MLENQNRRYYLGRAGVDGRVMLLKMPFVIDAVSLEGSVLPTFRGSFLPPPPEFNNLKMKGSCREKKLYLSSDVNITDLGLVQRCAVVNVVLCVRVL